MQVSEGQQVQIVQAAAAQGQAQTAQAQGQTMQVMQQIITNTGEIQQIPVRHDFKQEINQEEEEGGGWDEWMNEGERNKSKILYDWYSLTFLDTGRFVYSVLNSLVEIISGKLTVHCRKVNNSSCCSPE